MRISSFDRDLPSFMRSTARLLFSSKNLIKSLCTDESGHHLTLSVYSDLNVVHFSTPREVTYSQDCS